MSERLLNDVDPIETRDWQQAIESVMSVLSILSTNCFLKPAKVAFR